MADSVQLEILTPDGHAFSGAVREVVVPTTGGALGIFPNHTPLAAVAEPGVLDIRRKASDTRMEHFVIGNGLVEVTPTTVSLLVDEAVAGSSLKDLEAFKNRAAAARQKDESQTGREIAATQAGATKL